MSEPSTGPKKQSNGRKKQLSNEGKNSPPSPRRAWMNFGGARARSVENMPALAYQNRSPRPTSPPLTLTGSPGQPDGVVATASPLDTPPKKLWEHNFRSFLSRRSQQQQHQPDASFPPVPLIVPRQQLQQSQRQVSAGSKNEEDSQDHSVRGGKFFKSIFSSNDSQRRKTKSLNELDEPMRNGARKNYDSNNINKNNNHINIMSNNDPRFRKVHSHANVSMAGRDDQLNQTLHRASISGTGAGSIVPPPHHLQHYNAHLKQQRFMQQQQTQNGLFSQITPPPPNGPHVHHHYQMNHGQQPPQYTMSPNSAATEIKKAFTEFHNSAKYAADTTSAYLGDEPSGRFSSFNPGLVGTLCRCVTLY
mgnify:CR=1 FL=1